MTDSFEDHTAVIHPDHMVTIKPEVALLHRIFGLHQNDVHPYLVCGECGQEYVYHRPSWCTGCGFAGGSITCPPFRIMRGLASSLRGPDIKIRERYRKAFSHSADLADVLTTLQDAMGDAHTLGVALSVLPVWAADKLTSS